MHLRTVSGEETIGCKQAVDQWRKDACNKQQPQLLLNVPRGIFVNKVHRKPESCGEIMQSNFCAHPDYCERSKQ